MPATIQGPSGANVSKPLARLHWPSFFCKSRADDGRAGVRDRAGRLQENQRLLGQGLAELLRVVRVVDADGHDLRRRAGRAEGDVFKLPREAGGLPGAERIGEDFPRLAFLDDAPMDEVVLGSET